LIIKSTSQNEESSSNHLKTAFDFTLMAVSLLFSSIFLVFMVVFIQGSTLSTQRMDTTSVLHNADFYGRIVTNFEPSTDWKLMVDKPYNYAVSTDDLRCFISVIVTRLA
jgi:hypothetical protein